jgi:hypothetical protein
MASRLLHRRANASRNGGQWQEKDYDVFNGERETGRIYRTSGWIPWRRLCLVRLW